MVTVEVDEDDKKVHYDGLTRDAAMYVQTSFEYEAQRENPIICLNLMLAE